MPTVIGVFRYSGDAELAAAHLREEYVLGGGDIEVIVPDYATGADDAPVGTAWAMSMNVADVGTEWGARSTAPADLVRRRWGDLVARGQTLVVARSFDPEQARAMAHVLRRTGGEPVDVLSS